MKRKSGLCFIIAGAVLMLAALSLALWNWKDDIRSGESARDRLEALKEAMEEQQENPISQENTPSATDTHIYNDNYTDVFQQQGTLPSEEQPTEFNNSDTLPVDGDLFQEYATSTTTTTTRVIIPEEDFIQVDGNYYAGILTIPSLNLELPVLGEWNYDGLRVAPVRYQGLPETDDFIIAGHNYSSHFGTLGNLNSGDTIYFVDATGKLYTYEVMYTEVLADTSLEELTTIGEYDLTLFTCTLSGKSRVTVRCERVE